jgi:hypothetical protein
LTAAPTGATRRPRRPWQACREKLYRDLEDPSAREKPETAVKLRPLPFRRLAVAGVLALVGAASTACDTKAGTAAVVDGRKIGESTVSRNVPVNAAQTDRSRLFVLNYLIQAKLFDSALANHGGPVTDAELRALHDTAVSNLLRQQVAGSAADLALRSAVGSVGVQPDFAPTVLLAFEKELTLARRLNVQTVSGIAGEVGKQQLRVSVSPRYGGWDPRQLSMVAYSKSQAPSVITFSNRFPSEQSATTTP